MAYTPLLQEDGSDLYGEDGQPILAEESTGAAESGATGSGAVQENPDTASGTGTVGDAASGSGAVVEPPDTASGTGTALDRVVGTGTATEDPDTASGTGTVITSSRADALAARVLLGPPDGVRAAALTSLVLTGPGRTISARALTATVLVMAPPEPPPPPFIPRRPGRTEAPKETAERKRIIAPVKTLPEPPKEYDPTWMQANQEAILRHLDKTLTSDAPNTSVMIRSASGQVFELTIDDGGAIKATPKKG